MLVIVVGKPTFNNIKDTDKTRFTDMVQEITYYIPYIFKGSCMYIHEPFNILTILSGSSLPYVSTFKQLSLIIVLQ